MAKNTNLHVAKSAKNDEFYTSLGDVEYELKITRISSVTRKCCVTAMMTAGLHSSSISR